MKVSALSCPQCGATLKSDQTQCDHCGASVFLSDASGEIVSLDAVCPSCSKKNTPNDKHCGNCGQTLLIPCPNSNCLQENSVWRKFCKKCGVNLIEYRVENARVNQVKFEREISDHESAVVKIQNTLPAGKFREKAVKAIILVVGMLIALGFLADASPIIATIIGAIAALWGVLYESSEVINLESSLQLHAADLDRLQERKYRNDQEITSLAAIDSEVA